MDPIQRIRENETALRTADALEIGLVTPSVAARYEALGFREVRPRTWSRQGGVRSDEDINDFVFCSPISTPED